MKHNHLASTVHLFIIRLDHLVEQVELHNFSFGAQHGPKIVFSVFRFPFFYGLSFTISKRIILSSWYESLSQSDTNIWAITFTNNFSLLFAVIEFIFSSFQRPLLDTCVFAFLKYYLLSWPNSTQFNRLNNVQNRIIHEGPIWWNIMHWQIENIAFLHNQGLIVAFLQPWAEHL